MTGFLIAMAALVVFELVAWRFGADSRDGDDWLLKRHLHPGGSPRLPG